MMKSFVSEEDLEEIRKKRQEEWEKVRRPDQPLQRPEAVHDHRTLYERLQAQKDKKQEELAEKHALKNQIVGYDEEDVAFLDEVQREAVAAEDARWQEELDAIKSFRREKEAASTRALASSTATTLPLEDAHSNSNISSSSSSSSGGGGGGSSNGSYKLHSHPVKRSLPGSLTGLVVRRKGAPTVAKSESTASAAAPAVSSFCNNSSKRPRLAKDTSAVINNESKIVATATAAGLADSTMPTNGAAAKLPGLAQYGSESEDEESE